MMTAPKMMPAVLLMTLLKTYAKLPDSFVLQLAHIKLTAKFRSSGRLFMFSISLDLMKMETSTLSWT